MARTLSLLALALLIGAADGPQTSRVLVVGPAVAARAVTWGEARGGEDVLRVRVGRGKVQDVYGEAAWDLSRARPVAATRNVLVFSRWGSPGCDDDRGRVCLRIESLLAGPPRGPFRELTSGRPGCASSLLRGEVDAEQWTVATTEAACGSNEVRVVVRDLRTPDRSSVLFATSSRGCCDVRLAGRFAAWSIWDDVVVYDRARRRQLYRVRLPQRLRLVAFDVQRDGVVVAAGADRRTYEPLQVLAFSPQRRRGRAIPLQIVRGERVQLLVAADRVAALRFVSDRESELVVTTLRGRVQVLARFRRFERVRGGVRLSGDIDYDGRRVVWASTRTLDPGVQCPPNSGTIGPPCTSRPEVGETTIWQHDLSTGRRRPVARLPFETLGPLP